MNRKACIVLIGGPCSGKSSIGKLTADRLHIQYISSGDIARRMAEYDNAVMDTINSGGLAPEDEMRKSVYNSIYHCLKENDNDIVILDGFPRFIEQAIWLNDNIGDIADIHYVLVHAPSWILRDRAKKRDRHDDSSFEKRLKYYRNVTYKELYDNVDTIIDTSEAPISICSDLLIEFIKEVMKC